MKHKDARTLATYIREAIGCACTVPNGHGPDGYFARIWTSRTDDGTSQRQAPERPKDFYSRADFEAWRAACERERGRQERRSRPRSPIDILIDRACGVD